MKLQSSVFYLIGSDIAIDIFLRLDVIGSCSILKSTLFTISSYQADLWKFENFPTILYCEQKHAPWRCSQQTYKLNPKVFSFDLFNFSSVHILW